MTETIAGFAQYQPRQIRWRGLHAEPDLTLKVYGLSCSDGLPPSDDAIALAIQIAVRWFRTPLEPVMAAGVDWSTVPNHGLGVLIVHVGREATFALFDYWVGENMLRHHVWAASHSAPTQFETLKGSDMSMCVWEMAVLQHERAAWLRHVLTADGRADPAGYLADVLNVDI